MKIENATSTNKNSDYGCSASWDNKNKNPKSVKSGVNSGKNSNT